METSVLVTVKHSGPVMPKNCSCMLARLTHQYDVPWLFQSQPEFLRKVPEVPCSELGFFLWDHVVSNLLTSLWIAIQVFEEIFGSSFFFFFLRGLHPPVLRAYSWLCAPKGDSWQCSGDHLQSQSPHVQDQRSTPD